MFLSCFDTMDLDARIRAKLFYISALSMGSQNLSFFSKLENFEALKGTFGSDSSTIQPSVQHEDCLSKLQQY